LAPGGQQGLAPDAHWVPVTACPFSVPWASAEVDESARMSHSSVADFTVAPAGMPVMEMVPWPRFRIPVPAAT